MSLRHITVGMLVHFCPDARDPTNLWRVTETAGSNPARGVSLRRVWPPEATWSDKTVVKSMSMSAAQEMLSLPDPLVWGRFYREMHELFNTVFKQILAIPASEEEENP